MLKNIGVWLLPTGRRPSVLSVLSLHLLKMKRDLSSITLCKAWSRQDVTLVPFPIHIYFNICTLYCKNNILLSSISLITCAKGVYIIFLLHCCWHLILTQLMLSLHDNSWNNHETLKLHSTYPGFYKMQPWTPVYTTEM